MLGGESFGENRRHLCFGHEPQCSPTPPARRGMSIFRNSSAFWFGRGRECSGLPWKAAATSLFFDLAGGMGSRQEHPFFFLLPRQALSLKGMRIPLPLLSDLSLAMALFTWYDETVLVPQVPAF